ncbi:MFS transporter [Methylomonas rosea]|uniref:MFS transporter n=1 Tax=Methylomonas rosea TaxID=2952227 RepID=A0ABT1TYY6_9GAMM|nr:MFS transporter [Methylomonas sp. WSC-7]MCQ8119979.1 MFS transporter [Methylomonas sp. WSC-7]
MLEFRVDQVFAGYGAEPVLRDLSLQIPAGRVTAIVGANGCGKSTLLRCLARLHHPHSGRIRLNNEDLRHSSTADFARSVGFLPQFPQAPVGLSVNALLVLARHPHRHWMARWSEEDEAARREALRLTNLSDMAGQPLERLSGGQRQRAWMAMMLAQSTPVLLLDEPGSMLDPGHQLELIALLRALADAGRTIVVVMHDLIAARHADWLVALDDGRLAACGSPTEVLNPLLLRQLYGIDSHILTAPDGTPIAVPVRPEDWPLPQALPLPRLKLNAPTGLQERHLVRLLAVLQFILLLDYMVLMPLGAELMRDFDIGPARFGLLVGVYTLASALTSLVGGRWIDCGDRKRTLLTLYAGFVVASLACGLAVEFGALLAARALAGACAGLMSATMMAMIADRIEPERRGQAIGTIMSAFGVCAVIGVPSGLGLAALGGWRIPFFAVAALSALWWLRLYQALPKSPPGAGAGRGSLRSPALAFGWLLSFGIVFAGFLIVPYLGAHLNGTLGVGLRDLSWIYLCAGLATFAAARGVGRAVDRCGAARVLALLMVASMVPHLWLTWLQPGPLWQTTLVFVLFMVLTSTRAIPASVWLIGRVPPPLRGRYMTVNTASTEAASGLAAWCAGLMTGGNGALLHHFERVGWLAAGVTFLSLGLLAALNRVGAATGGALTRKPADQRTPVCEAES